MRAAGIILAIALALALQTTLARFLVRGGRHVPKEGSSRSRNVVLEFKDYETALACYNSPEYARLVAIRAPHSQGDLLIIEGYDGPQP